ncbi:YjbH domain-containing protein, partial [Salmonella enterica]
NKRYGEFDFSAGIAWGYLGSRGDFGNPLGALSDRFNERPTAEGSGNFSNGYFRGRPALFGGVAYQTPWAPLSLKLEYEGNDYQNEPRNNHLRQDSPVNLGLVYK